MSKNDVINSLSHVNCNQISEALSLFMHITRRETVRTLRRTDSSSIRNIIRLKLFKKISSI